MASFFNPCPLDKAENSDIIAKFAQKFSMQVCATAVRNVTAHARQAAAALSAAQETNARKERETNVATSERGDTSPKFNVGFKDVSEMSPDEIFEYICDMRTQGMDFETIQKKTCLWFGLLDDVRRLEKVKEIFEDKFQSCLRKAHGVHAFSTAVTDVKNSLDQRISSTTTIDGRTLTQAHTATFEVGARVNSSMPHSAKKNRKYERLRISNLAKVCENSVSEFQQGKENSAPR